MKMQWFQYDEKERIDKVYKNFTLQDFWKFWSRGETKVMEVRIKDWNLIKETGNYFKLPYSSSGVYVNNIKDLENVIKFVRNRATIWFGINPRKKSLNEKGWKVYGGKDVNVESVDFIFIDIDRTIKNDVATSLELEQCDKLANLILDSLAEQGWNKSYCKICSGNGVQLLIKLDFSIKLPTLDYDSKTKSYIEDEEYMKIRDLIRKGIGKNIIKFAESKKDELNVEVDKCFNIGRVGALPFSKNFKYNNVRWRAIVEIKDDKNIGLTDYCIGLYEKDKEYTVKPVFNVSKSIMLSNIIKPGKLRENNVVKLMLNYDLPPGQRNNLVWFQLKCLLRDSSFDLNSEEFKTFHREIQQKYKDTFPTNLPDKKFSFEVDIINRYCIENLIPPIYKLYSKRNKYNPLYDGEIDLFIVNYIDGEINISGKDIFEACKFVKEQYLFKEKCANNKVILYQFIQGCLKEYGKERTDYYVKYLFDKLINWE